MDGLEVLTCTADGPRLQLTVEGSKRVRNHKSMVVAVAGTSVDLQITAAREPALEHVLGIVAGASGGSVRREVVVGEHHVGGLLGHLGSGDAHRQADVGRLQRGRVRVVDLENLLAPLVAQQAALFTAATRFLESSRHQVSATDPMTFVAVAGVLLAVAVVAQGVPAARAMPVDPSIALRQD